MDGIRSGESYQTRTRKLSRLGGLAAVALCAFAMLLGPLDSFASHADLQDADDARGPLDVRTVRMSAGERTTWSVYTWERWRAATIWDRGFAVIKFDTFGDSHFDYYALVRSTGSRLRGSLHRDHSYKDDEQIRRLDVSRPNRGSLRVEVPLTAMRFSERYAFRWNVSTTWGSARCLGSICLDRAPDRGAVQEPPRPVPTPTITATPTPIPTESDR